MRQWEHTAAICSLLAEIHRDRDKRKEPFTITDFMPNFKRGDQPPPPQKDQTWQQQKSIIEMLNAALGGEDTRG